MSARQAAARRSIPTPLRFAWATCVGLLGVLLLGWLTALRGIMHALLVTFGAVAPAPFVLVLGLIAVSAAACLTAALIAEDSAVRGAAVAGGRSRLLAAYDAQVARQRRQPLAWGLAAGCGLGIVGLWLVLAALVVPLETRTLGILLVARARLDASAAGARPPSAAPDGLLRPSAWNPGSAPDDPVLDAFGHAIRRETRAGADVLRSLGLDGVASGDDVCVAGQTSHTLSSTAGAATGGDPLQFVEDLRADRLGWSAQLGALRKARCSALD